MHPAGVTVRVDPSVAFQLVMMMLLVSSASTHLLSSAGAVTVGVAFRVYSMLAEALQPSLVTVSVTVTGLPPASAAWVQVTVTEVPVPKAAKAEKRSGEDERGKDAGFEGTARGRHPLCVHFIMVLVAI